MHTQEPCVQDSPQMHSKAFTPCTCCSWEIKNITCNESTFTLNACPQTFCHGPSVASLGPAEFQHACFQCYRTAPMPWCTNMAHAVPHHAIPDTGSSAGSSAGSHTLLLAFLAWVSVGCRAQTWYGPNTFAFMNTQLSYTQQCRSAYIRIMHV